MRFLLLIVRFVRVQKITMCSNLLSGRLPEESASNFLSDERIINEYYELFTKMNLKEIL